MKRTGVILLLLCMVALLPLQVLAAVETKLETDRAEAAPGAEVTFTVTICGAEGLRSLGAMLFYDENSLELTGGEWLIDGFLSEVSTEEKVAVIALKATEKIDGPVLTLRFRVLPTAAAGNVEVGCKVVSSDGSGESKELGYPKAGITVTEAAQTAPEETVQPPTEQPEATIPDKQPEKQETDVKVPVQTQPASTDATADTAAESKKEAPKKPDILLWAALGVAVVLAAVIGLLSYKKKHRG